MQSSGKHQDNCTGILFQAPYRVTVTEGPMPVPAPHQLLVQTTASAISAGTELLFYRGQVPEGMSVDATLSALSNKHGARYPLVYGYAAVGRVTMVGAALEQSDWLGQRVFAFHPHASHFLAGPTDLLPIPDNTSDDQALFLPNMETAVNLVQDGAPLLGERVVVFGQGVVGLLTLHLLSRFPLEALIAVERVQARQERSLALGATSVLTAVTERSDTERPKADLVYELTGNPAVLSDAVNSTAYSGRVVVGSWYGQKRAEIDLGGYFHRNRIQLISSQVSTIAPHLQGRWSKARRFDTVWRMLQSLDSTSLISHRLSVHRAAEAYQLLDQQPDQVLQIIFTYP